MVSTVLNVHSTTLPEAAAMQLNGISDDNKMQVYSLLVELKSSMRRVEDEFIFMAMKLGQMHEILGDEVYSVVQDTLGMQRYQVTCLLTANKALSTHLTDADGRTDLRIAGRFTRGALRMFAPIEDGTVIAEVRQLAADGEKITEALIERLVKAQESDSDARVALAETEAEHAKQALAKANEKHEVDTLRLQNQITASAEQIRKMAEHRVLLEQEVENIQTQATAVAVETETVEKIPDGYTSLVAAMAAAQEQLSAVKKQEAEAQAELNSLMEKRTQLNSEVNALLEDNAQFEEITAMVDRCLHQYPQAKLALLFGENADRISKINQMANALIDFGTQLRNSTQRVA